MEDELNTTLSHKVPHPLLERSSDSGDSQTSSLPTSVLNNVQQAMNNYIVQLQGKVDRLEKSCDALRAETIAAREQAAEAKAAAMSIDTEFAKQRARMEVELNKYKVLTEQLLIRLSEKNETIGALSELANAKQHLLQYETHQHIVLALHLFTIFFYLALLIPHKLVVHLTLSIR